jgi:hypothetical protein
VTPAALAGWGWPRSRARAAAAALNPWRARNGFVFMGGGDNPTNALALHAFLTSSWGAIREALPGATLHVVGAPPRALCETMGLWCGWLAHTAYESASPYKAGVVLHGLVSDPDAVLALARVALCPMLDGGTGVNTKTLYYLSRGLPVVGTEKAARGYAPADATQREGLTAAIAVSPLGEALALEAVRLHENESQWDAASLAALELVATLHDERAPAADVAAVLEALERAAGMRRGFRGK